MQVENDMNCQKHPSFKLEHLKINKIVMNSNENLLHCGACLDEDNNNTQKDFVLIKKIIESGYSKIIPKWPPLNDDKLIDEIIQLEGSSISNKIVDFFDSFSKEILEKIESQKKRMMRVVETYEEEFDILKCYQEKSRIEELTKYISDPYLDIKEREAKCRSIIEEMHQNKQKNTNELKNIVQFNMELRKQADIDYMNSIKQSTLQMIEKLNFFEINIKQSQNIKNDEENKQQSINFEKNQKSIENIFSAAHKIVKHLKQDDLKRTLLLQKNSHLVLQLESISTDALQNLNNIVCELNIEKEVILILQEVITYLPNSSSAEKSNLYVGEYYFQQNNEQLSIPYFEKAISINPLNHDTFYKLGQMYYREDNNKAIHYLKLAVGLQSNNEKYYLLIGQCYFQEQQYDESINLLQQGSSINPNNSSIQFWLGKAYKEKKEYQKAISHFDKVKDQLSNQKNNQIGICYLRIHEFDMAMKYFQKQSAKFQDAASSYNIGVTYNKKRQFQEAIPYLQKAINLKNNVKIYYEEIGYSFEQMQNEKEAQKYYQIAYEMQSQNNSIQDGTSRLLENPQQ